MVAAEPARVWTIAEAKAKLSEVLRLAETEGPQHIGARRRFVVVAESEWDKSQSPQLHLGQWLIENLRGLNWEIPTDRASHREIPFLDDGGERGAI